jgi:hypothetical protein
VEVKNRRRVTFRSNIPKLISLEGPLSKITEAEFRDNAKNDAIKRAGIVRTGNGYILVVELTWKEGQFTLYTQRNEPRAWASFDRLIEYIGRHDLKLKSIEVQLEPD